MTEYFRRLVDDYRDWWRRPIRLNDRINSAIVGLIGGFWLGGLGRFLLGSTPVSLLTLLHWALALACMFLILGAMFPKVIGTALFPFAMMGPGGH